ncbi:MAG: DNA-3-methyladenine glycosylase 2 family protein [Cloacibacillus sp.]
MTEAAALYFEPTAEELEHLRRSDIKMDSAIDALGPLRRRAEPDLFAALVNHITAQQISNAAHKSVWTRLCSGLGDVTPAAVLAAKEEALCEYGLSRRKASYITALAESVTNGALALDDVLRMEDAEAAAALMRQPGIGLWTAEMALIFCMRRRDVLSFGDFGIRKGMTVVYGLTELPRSLFDEYRKKISPAGSAASLYFWEAAANQSKLKS